MTTRSPASGHLRFASKLGLGTSGIGTMNQVGRILVPPRGEKIERGVWAAPLELKLVFDYSYGGTLRAFEQSANRLGFSDFDLVHIHDVDRFTHGDAYEQVFDQRWTAAIAR